MMQNDVFIKQEPRFILTIGKNEPELLHFT